MDLSTFDAGWLSILPPIISIGLALLTKEVISSLLIGILTGSLIFSFGTGYGVIEGLQVAFGTISSSAGNVSSFNVLILFLALLGALVYVVNMAGGSKSYGAWASKKLKTRRGALLSTYLLGCVIFIDDYFNCLTVGTVMKPITDKYGVSRAKLAYIIDSTAAPICIIAPISSWAAAVGSNLVKTGSFGNSGLSAFIQSIPYNFYAMLSIVMVVILCATRLDYGPMRKSERLAQNGNIGAIDISPEDEMSVSEKGRVFDLVVPILALIIFSVLAMMHNGGFFAGGVSIADAFGNCDASAALVLGGFGALLVAFALYIPRNLLTFRGFMDGIGEGVKSMVPAFIILTLAWSISAVCNDLLGLGNFVGHAVETSNFPLVLIPAIVFLIASFLSFSTGTAWGTFGILIPIVVFVCDSATSQIMISSLAATLAGSIFGDHCSPISDTTILSSTGAGVDHIEHVSTQLPYALTVAVNSFIGYVIFGLTQNLYISLGSAIVLLVASILILSKISDKRNAATSLSSEDIVMEVKQ